MEVRSKKIEDWLNDIKRGIVRLPDFQREQAWEKEQIEKFIWAILQDRPLGIFLALEVSNNEEIETKPILTAPEGTGERCNMLILDGQQRLTSLWRSLNDTYEDKSILVEVEYRESQSKFEFKEVKALKKISSDTNNRHNKLNHIPVKYLRPGEEAMKQMESWLDQIEPGVKDKSEFKKFRSIIYDLRNKIASTTIPYYELPANMERDEVIDIFMVTNTSSVKLTNYDLAVALMSKNTKKNLRKIVDKIEDKVPGIEVLEAPVGELLLKIQCLRQGKKPNYQSFLEDLDFDKLLKGLGEIENGLKWAMELLDEIGIVTNQRLPSVVPLRVLPALYKYLPKRGTQRGHALKLAKIFLWWAFLTDRYNRQANDRLKEDFDELKDILEGNNINIDKINLKKKVSIFKCEIPKPREIMQATWPKNQSTFGRGILAACSLREFRDIATGETLYKKGVDYHHIFSRKQLRAAKLQRDEIYLALNCMLLNSDTNRNKWRDKLPGDFLKEEIQQAKLGDKTAKSEIKKRLETHLLPVESLVTIIEENIKDKDIKKAYKDFLNQRAKMVAERIGKLLTHGEYTKV